MACEDAEVVEALLSSAISTALSSPKKVTGDAGSVEMQSISDLIALSKYQSTRCYSSTARRGIRVTVLVPGSTV